MRIKYITSIFIALIFSLELASAYYLPPVRTFIENSVNAFIDIFEPILEVLLGGTDYTSYLLFERLLIFVILLSLVHLAIGFVPIFDNQKGVRRIVSIVVSLLGVRFLEHEWLLTIMVQYKVLAIALTAVLPFVIYFFFLHNIGDYPVLRKIGWIFFIIVYVGLWATSVDEGYSSIYFWTMFVALIFLLADGTIHRYYMLQQMKAANSTTKWEHIAKLRRDIEETNNDIVRGNIPERIGRNIIKKKQRQISWLMKQ